MTDAKELKFSEIVDIADEGLHDAIMKTTIAYTTENSISIVTVQASLAICLGEEIGRFADDLNEIETNTKGFSVFAADIAKIVFLQRQQPKEMH